MLQGTTYKLEKSAIAGFVILRLVIWCTRETSRPVEDGLAEQLSVVRVRSFMR